MKSALETDASLALDDPAAPSRTLIERAYAQLRNDIIEGRLLPGDKLRVEHLKERYGVGAGTLRIELGAWSTSGPATPAVLAAAPLGIATSMVAALADNAEINKADTAIFQQHQVAGMQVCMEAIAHH